MIQFIRCLVSDLFDRSAREEKSTLKEDILNPATLVNIGLPVFVTIITGVNQFHTSIISSIDYRVRLIVIIILLFVMLALSLRVIRKKKYGSYFSPRINASEKLYVYNHIHRQLSKLLLGLLIILIIMVGADLRFIINKDTSMEGYVFGPNARPLNGVIVEALNMDRFPVSIETATTDSYGRFVLDLHPDRGVAYYLELSKDRGSCRKSIKLANEFGILYPLWEDANAKIAFYTNCN